MKIDVIGCSTAWTDRPTSSYCINENMLVDCGEGTLKYYTRSNINFLNVKNIFITHLHGDHTFALYNYLCQYMAYSSEEEKKTLTIYGPVGIKKHLFEIVNNFCSDIDPNNVEEFINVVEITDFNITIYVNEFKVKVFCLKHGTLTDIAYIFDDDKIKIGFSGDCTLTPNVENFIQEAEKIFLECCAFETNKNHLGLNDYKMFVNKYPNKQFFAIHCIDKIYKNYKDLGIETAIDGKKYVF